MSSKVKNNHCTCKDNAFVLSSYTSPNRVGIALFPRFGSTKVFMRRKNRRQEGSFFVPSHVIVSGSPSSATMAKWEKRFALLTVLIVVGILIFHHHH
jgi:GMP synthase-like glutamine amidotransferase